MTQAIQEDDVASMKRLVDANAKLLSKPLVGRLASPLRYAIEQQKINSVKWLLQQNAPLGKVNNRTTTPLHLALARRGDQILDAVMSSNPDVNAKNSSMETPLMYAIKYPHNVKATVDKLLKRGASPNDTNRSKQNSLHLACYYNRKEVVGALMDAGASIDVVDSGGNTPFHAACMSSPESVKLFLNENVDPNRLNRQKYNALHLLCRSNNVDAVKLVIDQIRDIDQTGGDGETPLTMAVLGRKVELVSLLLEKGAKPNRVVTRRFRGRATALSLAATNGDLALVKVLLNAKSDPNFVGDRGNVPLHHVIESAIGARESVMNAKDAQRRMKVFGDIIQALLGAGAKPDMVNAAGMTPIQLAAQGDYFAGVELLADVSSNLSFQVGESKLIHWTSRNGLTRTARKLFEDDLNINLRNADGKTALVLATENGHESMVEFLLEKKADINQVDTNGMTPLMHAAYGGFPEIGKRLMANGAEVSRIDPDGMTALHYAAWSGADELIRGLAKQGGDVNAATPSGYTPLMAAAWSGHLPCCQALLQSGAALDKSDSDGWTPLHKAAYRGYGKVVAFLLKQGADRSLKTKAGMTARSLVPKAKPDIVKMLSN